MNVYHRGRLYWVHVAVFIVSILYCFICVMMDEMKYQMRPEAALLAIMLFLSMGIYIQMIFPDLRVDYLCVAVGNALLYNHRCRRFSRLDGLTMLLNRTQYEKDLERIKPPAVIINMDVDDFKQINDTSGHAAGDYYLRQIAEVIRTVYGRHGDCYRYGGDEFSLILTKNLHQMEKLNGMFEAALGQPRSAFVCKFELLFKVCNAAAQSRLRSFVHHYRVLLRFIARRTTRAASPCIKCNYSLPSKWPDTKAQEFQCFAA